MHGNEIDAREANEFYAHLHTLTLTHAHMKQKIQNDFRQNCSNQMPMEANTCKEKPLTQAKNVE